MRVTSSNGLRHEHAAFRDPAAGRVHLRVAWALMRPLARAVDWSPLAIAASLIVSVAALVPPGEPLGPVPALALLRTAALLLGAAAGFALVDAMSASTGAVPVPRWVRQWARTVIALSAAGLVWAATYAIVAARIVPGVAVTLPGLAVEAAVCMLVGSAGAATAVRRHPGRQAALGGAVAQLAAYAATLITGAGVWPALGDKHWDVTHAWWLAALPLPLLVLVAVHRDVR
ncbi:hypothetical protein GCM10023194_35380 [Planotetraspora phitsanulokensis]|uniref:Uncharacterized protein n=1 Tax=Planotetraspora phitsanulokensis TaxID=575192 RepID=A0A8J3XDA6_9ACTN|nr:hypothetical protein [Planotetraspora phitsanulokensis]GII36334.1 hypothetical protein Pph01_13370 [Planotetraspora phitsanulokensis]